MVVVIATMMRSTMAPPRRITDGGIMNLLKENSDAKCVKHMKVLNFERSEKFTLFRNNHYYQASTLLSNDDDFTLVSSKKRIAHAALAHTHTHTQARASIYHLVVVGSHSRARNKKKQQKKENSFSNS